MVPRPSRPPTLVTGSMATSPSTAPAVRTGGVVKSMRLFYEIVNKKPPKKRGGEGKKEKKGEKGGGERATFAALRHCRFGQILRRFVWLPRALPKKNRPRRGSPTMVARALFRHCFAALCAGGIPAWIFADRPCIAMRYVEASTTTVPDDSGYADGRHASLSGISDQYSSSLRTY